MPPETLLEVTLIGTLVTKPVMNLPHDNSQLATFSLSCPQRYHRTLDFNEAFNRDRQNSPVCQVNNPNSSITNSCRWKEAWVSIGQRRNFKIGFSLTSHTV